MPVQGNSYIEMTLYRTSEAQRASTPPEASGSAVKTGQTIYDQLSEIATRAIKTFSHGLQTIEKKMNRYLKFFMHTLESPKAPLYETYRTVLQQKMQTLINEHQHITHNVASYEYIIEEKIPRNREESQTVLDGIQEASRSL